MLTKRGIDSQPQVRTSMRPRGEPGIDDDRRSDSMRQNREDIDNRSPNPTILEQDRLGTKENQRPRTWPKCLARNRPRLEGEACAPRSETLSRRSEDCQSNPILAGRSVAGGERRGRSGEWRENMRGASVRPERLGWSNRGYASREFNVVQRRRAV